MTVFYGASEDWEPSAPRPVWVTAQGVTEWAAWIAATAVGAWLIAESVTRILLNEQVLAAIGIVAE